MRPVVLFFCIALCGIAAADCLTLEQAASSLGKTACVTGKVLKVAESRSGNFYLDFCENYRECPFTVFVPGKSIRDVGDVRQLAGKVIEVHGKIQQYGGRAEIVLKDVRQLKGEAASIPPAPKEFDASRHGNFSPKAKK